MASSRSGWIWAIAVNDAAGGRRWARGIWMSSGARDARWCMRAMNLSSPGNRPLTPGKSLLAAIAMQDAEVFRVDATNVCVEAWISRQDASNRCAHARNLVQHATVPCVRAREFRQNAMDRCADAKGICQDAADCAHHASIGRVNAKDCCVDARGFPQDADIFRQEDPARCAACG